jgi:hypothetical protein
MTDLFTEIGKKGRLGGVACRGEKARGAHRKPLAEVIL